MGSNSGCGLCFPFEFELDLCFTIIEINIFFRKTIFAFSRIPAFGDTPGFGTSRVVEVLDGNVPSPPDSRSHGRRRCSNFFFHFFEGAPFPNRAKMNAIYKGHFFLWKLLFFLHSPLFQKLYSKKSSFMKKDSHRDSR